MLDYAKGFSIDDVLISVTDHSEIKGTEIVGYYDTMKAGQYDLVLLSTDIFDNSTEVKFTLKVMEEVVYIPPQKTVKPKAPVKPEKPAPKPEDPIYVINGYNSKYTIEHITASAQAVINSMPAYLKNTVTNFEHTDTYSSDILPVAYARGSQVFWYHPNIMRNNTYLNKVMYHEVGHTWYNHNVGKFHNQGLHKRLTELYEEEWANTSHYGATNVREAVAETMADIHVGTGEAVGAPKFKAYVLELIEITK